MLPTRHFIIALCFAAGAAAPIIATADADEVQVASLEFHTSSRAPVFQTDVTQEEQLALRNKLWALTSQDATQVCDDIDASCGNAVAFD